jgi:hypothetical protein
MELAYLSLLGPPEGLSEGDLASVILESLGEASAPGADTHEPHTIALRLRLPVPVLLGLYEADAARRAASAIVDRGGDAFAPTIQELRALGGTMKVRDLALVEGEVRLELWDGVTTTVRHDDVFALVRAQLSGTIVTRDIGRGVDFIRSTLGPRTRAMMPRASREAWAASGSETKEFRTSDRLDLHTRDGHVFQLDGDKFGYAALGEMRGYSDRVNMDRMFELLQHVADHAVADHYFPLFKPPGSIRRLELPPPRTGTEDQRFAFYSRWVALMYRRLLGM